MKALAAFLVAVMRPLEFASASRLSLHNFPCFGHSGSTRTDSATKLEFPTVSTESAHALTEVSNAVAESYAAEFGQSALTELLAWPSAYLDLNSKFPAVTKAVDRFKAANEVFSQAQEDAPDSFPMADFIKHSERLYVAAHASQKAAEDARDACEAIIPNLQQGLDQAQKLKDAMQADAKRADAHAKESMLSWARSLNPWSEAATLVKTTKEKANAAAIAAVEAEEAVTYVNRWAYILDYMAWKSRAGAEHAKTEKEEAEASWGHSFMASSVLAQ